MILGFASISGCEDVNQVKRISLVKHLYFELYIGDHPPPNPTIENFRQSRSVKTTSKSIQKIFFADLKEGKFVFQADRKVKEGGILMIWDCGHYKITCTKEGAVKILEP